MAGFKLDEKAKTAIRTVRRGTRPTATQLEVDICVLGAGIAGTSAALEAAKLGRRVALVDGLPALGGQAVNSIIGSFCGLFSNGPNRTQLTHGIADGILADPHALRTRLRANLEPPAQQELQRRHAGVK